MRRAALSLLAVALAGMGVLVVNSPVRAECPFFVIPPATEAARSAREIIVGTVVENVGGNYSDFQFRIDHVLRGPAKVGEIRRFANLWPGWPLAKTAYGTTYGPCEPIRALAGNVIALSLDALAPDGITRYNAESWLSGSLPYNFEEPRTTLAEMETLARLPQTDTGTSPDQLVGRPGSPALVGVAFGVSATLLALVALRRLLRSASH
jgi:hypothetical protein